MAEQFTLVHISVCYHHRGSNFTTTSGIVYNLSGYRTKSSLSLPYLDLTQMGKLDTLLTRLNNGEELEELKEVSWIYGNFSCGGNGLPHGYVVKILPVITVEPSRESGKLYSVIIDNLYVHGEEGRASAAVPEAAQPGGSLYDKNGTLLYRGEMKNGVPHGYGTGYYANGKVGHVGLFKGGKIVQ
jgi:hypothetical protein